MLTDLKPVLASRTVWANIIGFIAFVLAAFGFGNNVLGDQGQLADAILQIVTGLSFVASTMFRVIASKKLG